MSQNTAALRLRRVSVNMSPMAETKQSTPESSMEDECGEKNMNETCETANNNVEKDDLEIEAISIETDKSEACAAPVTYTTCNSTYQMLLLFCSHTTAHGWVQVARPDNKVIRILWVILSVAALAISTLQVSIFVKIYMDQPLEMKRIPSTDRINFPSVTLCNIAAISSSIFDKLVRNRTTLTSQWYRRMENFDNYWEYFSKLNRTSQFYDIQARLQMPKGYFENIDLDEIRALSHHLEDMIISCSFGQADCNISVFQTFLSSDYYLCYTISVDDWTYAHSTGPTSGLSLVLYLEATTKDDDISIYGGKYFPRANTGNAAGVRVELHEDETRPSPLDCGLNVPPGFSGNIALTISRNYRRDTDKSPCRKSDVDTNSRYKYTSHTCMLSCQQKLIEQNCNCSSSSLPLAPIINERKPYCGTWAELGDDTLTGIEEFLQRIDCEDKMIRNFVKMNSTIEACNCVPACEDWTYESQTTYSYWPQEDSQDDFYEMFVEARPESKAYKILGPMNISRIQATDLIRKNFVRLNIFMSSLTVLQYQETPSYGEVKLLSDLGGIFGFWIGMSIMTWVEVIELLLHLIKHHCRRLVIYVGTKSPDETHVGCHS